MDQHDELSLACAACDLSARWRGELRREQARLACTQQQLLQAGSGDRRRDLRHLCHNQRASILALRYVLARVTTCYGDCHAACVA